MTEIKINSENCGQVQIADDVIAIIAGTAALECKGVISTGSLISNDFVGMIGKRNFSKGVKVAVNEEVSLEITLNVKFGYKVHEIAEEVQKRVKNAVETMTGLAVADIDIIVASVVFVKDKNMDIEK